MAKHKQPSAKECPHAWRYVSGHSIVDEDTLEIVGDYKRYKCACGAKLETTEYFTEEAFIKYQGLDD
jgi:hypothetical protein